MEGSNSQINTLESQIIKNIQDHIPSWNTVNFNISHIKIQKLSGLSNAVYKVNINLDEVQKSNNKHYEDEIIKIEPKSLVYRVFECKIIDKYVEKTVFAFMSENGMGPKLFYQNDEFRIEEFFLSRPITIFELRNEIFYKGFAQKICNFNYNSDL